MPKSKSKRRTIKRNITRLEDVAFAMHCNLRPRDVAPVYLGFNCEAHNALFQQFRNLYALTMHQRTKFQHKRAMHGWVIDDSTNFPASFQRAFNEPLILRVGWTELYKFRANIGQSELSPYVVNFPCVAPFRSERDSKGDWNRKSSPNSHLLLPVKFTGGLQVKCLSEFLWLSTGSKL